MKKVILCVLTLALLLSMAACVQQTAAPTTEPTVPTTTEATEPPPPPRLTGERIVDGRSRCTAVYHYDENDRLIRIDRTHDADGSVYNYEIFQYDDQGRLLKQEKWLNQDVPGQFTSYIYDENGQLVRINHDKVHEAVWNWYEVRYDSTGRVEKYDVYEEKKGLPILTGHIYFTYDAQGQVLTQMEYDLEENLLSSVTNTYNELGQLTQAETHIQGTNFDTRTVDIYEYDQAGLCLSWIHEIYSDDLPFSTVKTAYIWEQPE